MTNKKETKRLAEMYVLQNLYDNEARRHLLVFLEFNSDYKEAVQIPKIYKAFKKSGKSMTYNTYHDHISWMEGQGLITVAMIKDPLRVKIVQLTELGREAANIIHSHFIKSAHWKRK